MSNDLVVIDNKLMEFGYSESDLAELTQEEKQILAEALKEDSGGYDFKPVEIKINKDLRKFVDPFGETVSSLKGNIIYKAKIRGHWPKGQGKIPRCSSIGCVAGIVTDTNEKVSCNSCEYNQWGTAVDDAGNPTRGKACAAKRLMFLEVEGYKKPIILRIPTTSITEYDTYFSTRETQNKKDFQYGVVVTLEKAEAHDFEFAKAKFALGDEVHISKQMELIKLRKEMQDYLDTSFQMTADDEYVDDDSESNIDLDSDVSAEDIA